MIIVKGYFVKRKDANVKTGKVIDFATYREQRFTNKDIPLPVCPEDLITAINNLIQRLREHKPLKQTG
jgi:hypothetical protein